MFNGGLAGSDPNEVRKHVEELAAAGIPPSKHVPTLYAVGAHLLTSENRIQVHADKTGGEVEFVLIWHEGHIYVTVGSDHTDFWLEKHSSPKAKNVCQNVISSRAWRLRDVEEHFGQLILESEVRVDGKWRLYQRDQAGALLGPDYWVDRLASRVETTEGLVFFSGTISALDGLVSGDAYRVRMIDPVFNRTLAHEYRCTIISGMEDF